MSMAKRSNPAKTMRSRMESSAGPKPTSLSKLQHKSTESVYTMKALCSQQKWNAWLVASKMMDGSNAVPQTVSVTPS